MPKEILCAFSIHCDAVAGWLGSYMGEDSPGDISRGVFAAEVGMPRTLRLFERFGLKQSWFIPGHTIESFPEQTDMVAKAGQREDKRRTEAKENGIILERFGAKSAGGAGAATRGGGKDRKRGGSALGIGGPDVGTYRGATLRLSKNDIKGIEGSSKRGGRGGRGGGRGGKRKGPAKFGSGV